MSKTATYTIIILIVVGLLVAAYALFRSTFYDVGSGASTTDTIALPQDEQRVLSVKHAFNNGTHSYVGEMIMPTPCSTLSWAVSRAGDSNATIAFTSTPSSEICAQVITAVPFKVQMQGSERMTIQATLDNAPLKLNIIEVPQGEIDSFMIPSKG